MKKGSALLIVLGMLAFMVVSAVGFSMYMRQSRAPSSYLRRNIASRYLVKAALANAIEDLEGNYNEDDGQNDRPLWGGRDTDSYDLQNHFFGIYDDPYPGCGPDNQYAGADPHRNGDYWLKRVFCPFGPIGEPSSKDDAMDEAEQNPTVPTLTLEALAYLPPAIVDDVRKVSRLTRTACWRPLPSDAGRFAYTAVNVSDCFDINRLQVAARDSAACRISLASLCTTDATDPLSFNDGDATALKTAAEKWLSSNPDAPYVSLADFAMLNAKTDYSPFTKFIGGTSGSLLSGGNAREANALFITDTWFPVTPAAAAASSQPNNPAANTSGSAAGGSVVFDLAGGHQPFRAGTFGSSSAAQNFLEVSNQKNPQDNAGDIFLKNLGVGMVCLYDYLDRDSQPMSLSLPTTEAVPMVIGLSAPGGLQPTIGQIGGDENGQWEIQGTVTKSDGTQEAGKAEVRRTARKKGITSFGSTAVVKLLTTYPFKRMATENRTKSFSVRGVMRVFLAKSGMRTRLVNNANNKIRLTDKAIWTQNGGSALEGVATFVSDTKQISAYSGDIRKWENAVDDSVNLTFSNLGVNMPLYWQVEETYGAITPAGGAFTPNDEADKPRASFKSLGNLASDNTALIPLDANGNLFGNATDWNGPWQINTKGEGGAKDMSGAAVLEEPFRVQVAVWVQVLADGEVVDMVPACVADDNTFLNAGLPDANDVGMKCGDGVPLLNFTAMTDIKYSAIDDLAKVVDFTDCASLYAVDPRFNFAPENWFAKDEKEVHKQTWHDFAEQEYWGGGGDRDIFMFVSDQEYLQDIGELQFLPNLQTMNGNASSILGGDYSPNFNGEPFSLRKDNSAAFACKDFFWSTYTAYDNGSGTDPIYALPYSGYPNGVRFHSGIGQFKANPYSEDDRILYAAIADTPADYYIASTNVLDSNVNRITDRNAEHHITVNKMMDKYSISSSGDQTLTDDNISDIGDRICEVFQNAARSGNANWEATWNSGLMAQNQWQENGDDAKCDENEKFLGIELGRVLHGVDRKFLASYWRECFANRQQLFLIFVRAEPTAVGGGASGSLTSAQLGARAVALVWRDPAKPTYQVANRKARADYYSNRDDFRRMKRETPTHQTRILFYHQFD